MSQYSTDFSGYTLDSQPSDWTKKWNTTNSSFTVVEKSAHGYALEADFSTTDRCGLAWDVVGSVNDCEILARVLSTYPYYPTTYIIARGGGAEGSEEGIRVYFTGNDLRISSYGGSFSAQDLLDTSSNTWYWIRLSVSGTAVKARAWSGDLIDEPSTWQAEVTETNLTSGWIGVAHYRRIFEGYWDWFSVGTGTDSAPEPVAPALRINQARIQALYSESAGTDLTIGAVQQAQGLGSLTLDQASSLVMTGVNQGQTVEVAGLNQVSDLSIAEVQQAQAASSLVVAILVELTIEGVTQSQSLEELAVTTVSGITILDVSQEQSFGTLSFAQISALAVSDVDQAHLVESPLIEQISYLVTESLSQAHSMGVPSLVSFAELLIENLSQSQLIQSATLTIAVGYVRIELTPRVPGTNFKTRQPGGHYDTREPKISFEG